MLSMPLKFQPALLLIITIVCYGFSSPNSSLDIVVILFRHGDRTPLRSYPTDRYAERDWPNGYGQLTSRGQEQLVKLGQRLRAHYSPYLKVNFSHFNAKQVMVRSTDFDRTLMSAMCLLKGLYDDGVVVPVHSVERNRDILITNKILCPRYQQLTELSLKSEEAHKTENRLHDLFEELARYTGVPHVGVEAAEWIWDTLYIEEIYSRLPSWAMRIWDELNAEMQKVRWQYFRLKSLTLEMVRLQMGVFLRELLKVFNKDGLANDLALALYSAHDTTVSALLSVFGALDSNPPPSYGGFVVLEIRKQTNGLRTINVSYANKSNGELKALAIPCQCPDGPGIAVSNGKSMTCSLKCFEHSIGHFILSPDELSRQCTSKESEGCLSVLFYFRLVFISFPFVCAFLAIAVLCRKVVRNPFEYKR